MVLCSCCCCCYCCGDAFVAVRFVEDAAVEVAVAVLTAAVLVPPAIDCVPSVLLLQLLL